MKTIIASLAFILSAAVNSFAALPDEPVVQALTAAIRQRCPDAEIAVTNGFFVAKSGTMMFTRHLVRMTGEVMTNTFQEEGPNVRGFALVVEIEPGPYRGQTAIPQEFHGTYYTTFFDGPPTRDHRDHYWIRFAYGGRLDPELKEAIFKALPKELESNRNSNRL